MAWVKLTAQALGTGVLGGFIMYLILSGITGTFCH